MGRFPRLPARSASPPSPTRFSDQPAACLGGCAPGTASGVPKLPDDAPPVSPASEEEPAAPSIAR